ncbi:MAG TPA: lytic transglycosylase domain-containing protein [Rhizomicrobium sp.]
MAKFRAFLLAAAAAFSIAPAFAQDTSAPGVLSMDDVGRYRRIFEDERTGRFSDAQALVAQLSDRSLLGYAEGLHYLSDYSEPAGVDELVSWLDQNKDLAIADRIYDLAVKRATKVIKRHHRVVAVRVTATVPTPTPVPHLRSGGYEDFADTPEEPISSEAGRAALVQIAADIKADQPAQADTALQTLASSGSAPAADVARLSSRVAASYMAEGQNFEAFDVASRPNTFDRQTAPSLDWWAGLAAFRMGKFDIAAQHFETLAQNGAIPSWTRSGAAFWAARSYMENGDPLKVITLLTAAAREQPTFYGMIAQRILGQDYSGTLSDPLMDAASFNTLVQDPAAHRAVALWQTGETEYLHQEMARAMSEMDPRNCQTYAALARRMNLPDLELRASEAVAAHGTLLTGLFPVPTYSPSGGYHMDKSLVLAFARIESRFQPAVTSRTGANGLMQLMPGTAAHLSDGASSISELHDPSYNMMLGQKYLEELLDTTNGNLLQLAAAYNAGPGSLQRWLAQRDGKHDDPLTFIESMPAPETRSYVKRLMTYYWMYSKRMGTAAPTLDEAAAGTWPRYQPKYAVPVSVPAHVLPAQPAQQPEQQDKPQNMLVSDASLH